MTAATSLGTARQWGREGLAMEQTERFHTCRGPGESETGKGDKGYTPVRTA